MARMPSWNIHTAHAERLLNEEGPDALGIRDQDSFLLGNLAPDIYVGHMVPEASRRIDYRCTHFADANFVPEPPYWEFFEQYAQPATADGRVSDVVLGAWVHLVADNTYNRHSNAYLYAHDIQPCDETRQRKQSDFALFGRTLDISRAPRPTDEVIAQAAAFPQYVIDEVDVRETCTVMEGIVADNTLRHVTGTPAYDMLPAEFFEAAYEEAHTLMLVGLRAYARGECAWGERR